jgi:serine/threonine-protein kinase
MSSLLDRLAKGLEGRYTVEREIGRGGMAVVYLAEDVKHRRSVAIKVLRPEVAPALGGERFLREIEIAAQLSHPNILALHDSGEAAGLLYFVMPYVDGESLRDRLVREGTLPLDEAVRVTRQVADALSFAHERGLIHRDVKPENILFHAGHAVVADFGIARAVSDAGGSRLTETGLSLGTVAYMSPEQATGETRLDARTDVYALGCVLYECLAGAPPFPGSTAQAVLARKIVDEVPPLTARQHDVPPTVELVLRRALARDAAQRYATPADLSAALSTAVTATEIERDRRRRRRLRTWRGAGAALLLVALGGLGWWGTSILSGPAYERLAVLPISNPGNDPAQDYFVEGIHDALITELGLAGVTVIGRQSVMRYRGSDTPIRAIARELGLDAVVEGSATLVGDSSLAVSVRLLDARTEAQLWGGSYDDDIRNVMAIYRDVTREIASQIRLALSPEAEARLRVAAAPQVDPQAYEAILQGHFYRSRLTRESLETAQRYFERALEIDPENAAAYAGLATVWGGRAQNGFISVEEARPPAEAAVRRALELGDDLAEVHYTLAGRRTWVDWDWEGAGRAFERALELDPNHAQTRAYYSHYLHYVGRPDEAVAQIERALELDPLDPLVQGLYAMELMYERRFEFAIDRLEEVLRTSPRDPIALSTLRTAYHMTGRHEQAMDIWRRSYEGDPARLAALERGWEAGGYSGALRAAAEALEAQSETSFVTPWQIGTLYTRAGDAQRALDYLERAFEARDPNLPYLSVDPIFDFMREDPRFQDLMRGLDLPI